MKEGDMAGSDFYKLGNNAVHGKTCKDVGKRTEIRICTSSKLFSQSNYKNDQIFSENLVAVEMRKTTAIFNKPIYVRCIILKES